MKYWKYSLPLLAAALMLTAPAETNATQFRLPFKTKTTELQKTDVWIPLYDGIDFMRCESTSPIQKVCILRIDTENKDLEFYTTGRHPDYKDEESETLRETAVDFLNENDMLAAINANFYSPFNATTRTTRGPSNVIGLAISDGVLVSSSEGNSPCFTVNSDGVKTIRAIKEEDPLDGIRTAVAGKPIILKDGEIVKQGDEAVHPRTAVGISKDNRYVYFMTIDGRQVQSIGATLENEAMWLKKAGAWDGLNLDGGGSTTMVIRTPEGETKVLNSPIGNANIKGYLRNNANHIGVRKVKK